MKVTIYLDVLFLINFGMNLLIVWLTGYICGRQAVWWRYLLSPLAGSILFVLLVWIPIPAKWIYYICGYGITGMLMCYLAYQPKGIKSILRCYSCQLVTTFLLGGVMNWLYFSTPFSDWLVRQFGQKGLQLRELVLLAWFSGMILAVLTAGFRRYRKEQHMDLYQVSLYFEDKNVYGVGWLDTGNFLTEPISRRPVVVADPVWIQSILPEEYRDLVSVYIEEGRIDYDRIADKRLKKARWIPYQAVGEAQGDMLGILCAKMILRVRDICMIREQVIVGISRTPLSDRNRYQMLLHTDIVKQEEYICCR